MLANNLESRETVNITNLVRFFLTQGSIFVREGPPAKIMAV